VSSGSLTARSSGPRFLSTFKANICRAGRRPHRRRHAPIRRRFEAPRPSVEELAPSPTAFGRMSAATLQCREARCQPPPEGWFRASDSLRGQDRSRERPGVQHPFGPIGRCPVAYHRHADYGRWGSRYRCRPFGVAPPRWSGQPRTAGLRAGSRWTWRPRLPHAASNPYETHAL
jgi:hypothetical protein